MPAEKPFPPGTSDWHQVLSRGRETHPRIPRRRQMRERIRNVGSRSAFGNGHLHIGGDNLLRSLKTGFEQPLVMLSTTTAATIRDNCRQDAGDDHGALLFFRTDLRRIVRSELALALRMNHAGAMGWGGAIRNLLTRHARSLHLRRICVRAFTCLRARIEHPATLAKTNSRQSCLLLPLIAPFIQTLFTQNAFRFTRAHAFVRENKRKVAGACDTRRLL